LLCLTFDKIASKAHLVSVPVPKELGLQGMTAAFPSKKIWAKLIRFGQICSDLGKLWAKLSEI